MIKWKYLLPNIFLVLLAFSARAQGGDTVEMADVMRSNGRIYVVVAVVVVILLGLFLYLLRIERKIKKIEEGN